MSDVKTFRRKPWETQGITWTGKNTREVIEFAEHHSYTAVFYEDIDEIICKGNGPDIFLNLEDTLLGRGEEQLEVVDQYDMEEDFEEVT